ncbi:hypothetical protein NO1_0261 [Candidatus Termititenax aidoneus]|uniref:Uncharacterized protein n=1 Tax=Termititenax aidoneus TaxID=2218524 RepID=A0A388T9B4_TERA1|nr:hypothetical protein NO1_0261 [Candidatus Termititenax aidoneus]
MSYWDATQSGATTLASLTSSAKWNIPDINYDILNINADYRDIEAEQRQIKAEQEASILRRQFAGAVGTHITNTAARNIKVGEGSARQNVEDSAVELGQDIDTMRENARFEADQLRSEANLLREQAETERRLNETQREMETAEAWSRLSALYGSTTLQQKQTTPTQAVATSADGETKPLETAPTTASAQVTTKQSTPAQNTAIDESKQTIFDKSAENLGLKKPVNPSQFIISDSLKTLITRIEKVSSGKVTLVPYSDGTYDLVENGKILSSGNISELKGNYQLSYSKKKGFSMEGT